MAVLIGGAGELEVDCNDVCDFYARHWDRKSVLSVGSFYNWQFKSSPSAKGIDHCIVAIDSYSREILGVMGLNSRPFYLDGLVSKGAELTTWIVNEKHLNKGVGAKILKEIQSRYDVLIGMGITEIALPVYMRSGFRFIKALPRFIKVFDFNAVLPYAEYNPLANKLIKKWSGLGNNVQFFIENINANNTIFLKDVIPEEYNYFTRSFEYLEWRYTNHPIFKYKQFIVYSEVLHQGNGVYVCLREELSVDNLKIIHVMDCIGDMSEIPAALSFIHDYCVNNQVHVADFYCSTVKISRYFANVGWFSLNDDVFFNFPHLFQPVELRNPATTSLIYWSKENFIEISDISKLYITKEDADLDRPTYATYKLSMECED